jgi:23S rRNA pseudouridine1911/1915/1917 synthase
MPATPPDPGRDLAFEVAAPTRLDRLLARDLPLSRTRAQALLEDGHVRVDGLVVRRASFVPAAGSRVRVRVPPPEPSGLEPDPFPLEILFEDAWLIALVKPAGLVVHPAPGHPRGTLVNALVARGSLPDEPGTRPGIVHRLDRDTSGVMVVARSEEAHRELARQFKAREVVKVYDAVTWGHLPSSRGTVERPIARSRSDRQRMAVDVRRGRSAFTAWRVLARYDVAEHLQVEPASGRTHQIRVHLASLGHPIVGDARYGGGAGVEAGFGGVQRARVRGALAACGRPALHARRLELRHPVTGEPLAFEAAPPADLRRLLDYLAGAVVTPAEEPLVPVEDRRS